MTTQLCSNNQLYKAALRASTTHANLMRHNACTTQPLCVQQAKLAPCAQANRRQDTQRRMRGMHTASTSVKSAFAAHMLATTTCAPDLYYVCHSLASVQATPGHSIKSVRHLVLQALQHLAPSAPTWPILVLLTALLAVAALVHLAVRKQPWHCHLLPQAAQQIESSARTQQHQQADPCHVPGRAPA